MERAKLSLGPKLEQEIRERMLIEGFLGPFSKFLVLLIMRGLAQNGPIKAATIANEENAENGPKSEEMSGAIHRLLGG